MTLEDKIRAYIVKKTTPVSLTDLMERSTGRYTSDEMFVALQRLHRFKDIQKTTTGGEIYYSLKQYKAARAIEPYFTADFPYPVMDASNDTQHPIFEGYIQISGLVQTREERQAEQAVIARQRGLPIFYG